MKLKLSSLAIAIVIVVVGSVTGSVAASTCGSLSGHTYAVQIQGAEFFNGTMPSSQAPVPTPIVGLAAIEINASCAVTGEMIYDDNDTFTAPAACTPGGVGVAYAPPTISLTVVSYSGWVPCFNGTTSQLSGSAVLNSAGAGTLTIANAPSFIFAPPGGTNTPYSGPRITLSFNISEGLGGTEFTGTTISNDSASPAQPILTLNAEKNGISTTIPPNTPNVWGSAPWVGQRSYTCTGLLTADNTTFPGGFFSQTGGYVIFSNGSVGAYSNQNANNNWVGSPFPSSCHSEYAVQSGGADGPYADGTVDLYSVPRGPYDGSCLGANIAGAVSISQIVWGPTGTNLWTIGTGGGADVETGGAYGSLEDTALCTAQPAPAIAPKAPVTVAATKAETLNLAFTNASASDCAVTLTEVNASGSNFASLCSLTQDSALTEVYWDAIESPDPSGPYLSVYPGYASTDATAIQLVCTAKPSKTGNSISVGSPDCPALNGKQITVNN